MKGDTLNLKGIAKLLGQRGGLARAKALTKQQRLEISQHANKAKAKKLVQKRKVETDHHDRIIMQPMARLVASLKSKSNGTAKKAKKGKAIMKTLGIALLGLLFLSGCSGGGSEEPAASQTSTPPSQTPPTPPSQVLPRVQPEMLTVTSQGLLRGLADGQGQRLIFAKPNLYWSTAIETQGIVTQGQVLYYNAGDEGNIWAVRTDGTNDRPVLNTPAREDISTVNGPWLIYRKETLPPGERSDVSFGSVNLETGAQFPFDDSDGTEFMPASPTRLISTTSQRQMSSLSVTGTDRITYASLTPEDDGTFLRPSQIIGNTLIYSRSASIAPSTFYSRSYAIPLAGGTATLLDEEQYDTYSSSAWSIGDRVVYHRTAPYPAPWQNDVVSVQINGSNRVALTNNPANEAVQGVTTNHVIIRRNLSGTDHLIAVPVGGGPETLLMVMTNDEFMTMIIGDLMIVRRPSGTWSLDLNAKLTQLGTVSWFDPVAVGDSVCVNPYRRAVWCMPLDGSGPQVKIADEGRVVAVLTP